MMPCDFLIVTPLEEERDAILELLPDHHRLDPSPDYSWTYYTSDLPTTFPSGLVAKYRLVIMPLITMGQINATLAVTHAIQHWNPRYIMVVGIAGGVKSNKVRLGDVIISDQVAYYELQRLDSKASEVRWEFFRADPTLLGAVRNLRSNEWYNTKRQRPNKDHPKRLVGVIASGEKVVASASFQHELLSKMPRIIGFEMEAAGAASAVYLAKKESSSLTIRGVADLADKDKNASNVAKWRPYACAIAASYTITLLRSGPVPVLPVSITPSILWVDDIPSNNLDEIRRFRQTGIIVRQVRRNDEALRILGTSVFQLVITDITRNNQTSNGLDLIRSISQRYPGLPVIVYTSPKIGDKYGSVVRNTGARAVLVTPEDLEACVTEILFKSTRL